MNTFKKTVEKILLKSGVAINGTKPHDIHVHNEKFFKRVLREESMGLGESYMEGWWDCNALDEFFLEPGMKVLDIGCGWGGFAAYASKNYKVQVTEVTISSKS